GRDRGVGRGRRAAPRRRPEPGASPGFLTRRSVPRTVFRPVYEGTPNGHAPGELRRGPAGRITREPVHMSDRSHAADAAGRTDPERPAPPDVVVRPPATLEEFRACVELQRETWGADFEECVPAAILKVSGRIGGVTAGALDGAGGLLGFVFGLTGLDGGRLVHWSHMLAVRAEWRDRGRGRRRRLYQREAVARLGAEAIYWTFDPLVARNAHLNLNRLGARVVEYVEDMYGPTGSHLHAGLGTDRLVIAWPVQGTEAAGE